MKIGIIGGSGLDDPDIISNRHEMQADTKFGKPSDALILGNIGDVDVVLLARHGRKHSIMPSKVNFRANIMALKEQGCTHILASTACGSLKEEIEPGHLVFIDQFIDRTTKRHSTFYDENEVCHIPMANPFCEKLRNMLIESAEKFGYKHAKKGTVITIEGPRFSSKAESRLFRSWNADVINMTTVPEVVLARETGICYAAIAMATDYDCFLENRPAVTLDEVLKVMKENSDKVKNIFLDVIPKIKYDKCECREHIKGAVIKSH